MCTQLKRVDPNLVNLQAKWADLIYGKGFEMLNDDQLAKKNFRAIEDFIQFRAKSEDLVKRVFGMAENKIVRVAFEKILNVDSNIIAEYIAKFLDFHLKKS